MSKIKDTGLDQCGAEPFEQQSFGPAGIEVVKLLSTDAPCGPRSCRPDPFPGI